MRVLLLPLGTAGDVFPFLWLGRKLVECGHQVTLVASGHFEENARLAGLQFVPWGNPEEIEAMGRDPRLWNAMLAPIIAMRFMARQVPAHLEAIERCGDVDLMLAHGIALTARLMREKKGTPLITVHLQPTVLASVHDTPQFHPAFGWLRWMPRWVKRVFFALPNFVDLMMLRVMRRAARAHGVRCPLRLWWAWWNSPDGVLTLFPGWSAPRQPDWPEPLFQGGFLLEDVADQLPMSQSLRDFLAAGTPPVVFTPGTGNLQAARFFAVAAEAVTKLGCRAVFATMDPRQVPADLPPQIYVTQYAPFSQLFKHASVVVHHGGVGTMSQAFAAGVPQLVMPMAYDQPDNAIRVEKLGAGLALKTRRFTPDGVFTALQRLMNEPSFRNASARCAQQIRTDLDQEALMSWIEQRACAS